MVILPMVQQRSDALIKRYPGEAHQQSVSQIPSVFIVFGIVAEIVAALLDLQADDPRREAFTQNAVSQAIQQHPDFNWVICHSPYSPAFDGVEGTNWGYTHHELGIFLGRTIGYDLYWATSGTFYRYVDGGFVNAYDGWVSGTDDGGVTVYFTTPPGASS